MPISLPNLFRLVIMFALAFHVFYMYSMGRILAANFGFSLSTSIGIALFALVLLIPFVWAVALPELPEMYLRHVRGRRRFDHGQCQSCGYELRGSAGRACPECGEMPSRPEPYAIRWRTIRLFVTIALLAWVLGCVSAEVWAAHDEYRFKQEVAERIERGDAEDYFRGRRWPGTHGGLLYRNGRFIAHD